MTNVTANALEIYKGYNKQICLENKSGISTFIEWQKCSTLQKREKIINYLGGKEIKIDIVRFFKIVYIPKLST